MIKTTCLSLTFYSVFIWLIVIFTHNNLILSSYETKCDSLKESSEIDSLVKQRVLEGLDSIYQEYCYQIDTSEKFWGLYNEYSSKGKGVDSFLSKLRQDIENTYKFHYQQKKLIELKDSIYFEIVKPRISNAVTWKERKEIEASYPNFYEIKGKVNNDTILLDGRKITEISKDSIGWIRYSHRDFDEQYFYRDLLNYSFHSDSKKQFTLEISDTIFLIDAYKLKTEYMLAVENENYYFQHFIYYKMSTNGSSLESNIITIMSENKVDYELQSALTSYELNPSQFFTFDGYILEYDDNMQFRQASKFENGNKVSGNKYELLKLKSTEDSLYNKHLYASDWFLKKKGVPSDSVYVYTIVNN